MAVKVDGWGAGIAWELLGPELVDDDDTEWTGYQVETGRVLVCMIGDDRVFAVDPEDVTEIPADSYCRDCGQVGCGSNVYA